MPNIKKPKSAAVTETHKQAFDQIVSIIRNARKKTFQTVNTALIDLYWQVGEYISRKIQSAAWGEGVIDQLAGYIAERHPNIKGFNRRNLYRMKQIHETYNNQAIVSPLVRQLPWTHNLIILSKCKREVEGEFKKKKAGVYRMVEPGMILVFLWGQKELWILMPICTYYRSLCLVRFSLLERARSGC